MKKFLGGLFVGLIVGTLLGMLIWITRLPGPPSQYHARHPIATEPLPDTAAHAVPHTIGFDIYKNPKAPPIFGKDDETPKTNVRTWTKSSGHQGEINIRGSFWIEYGRKLYEIGQYQWRGETSPNRHMSMITIQSVDTNRQLWERVIIL